MNYFSGFKNIQDYKEKTVEEHRVLLNNLAVANLNDYFTRMHSKLPIEPISPMIMSFIIINVGLNVSLIIHGKDI